MICKFYGLKDYEATFCPSTPGSMKWLYLKVHMLLVKEKCKCISKCQIMFVVETK